MPPPPIQLQIVFLECCDTVGWWQEGRLGCTKCHTSDPQRFLFGRPMATWPNPEHTLEECITNNENPTVTIVRSIPTEPDVFISSDRSVGQTKRTGIMGDYIWLWRRRSGRPRQMTKTCTVEYDHWSFSLCLAAAHWCAQHYGSSWKCQCHWHAPDDDVDFGVIPACGTHTCRYSATN